MVRCFGKHITKAHARRLRRYEISSTEKYALLATFDNSVKRIVTMGASAGCYVIISIAEAQDGGLPSMLRSAMSTKVLIRPTMPEARLLWPPEKLEALATSARVYGPGDAWFSSTNGVYDGGLMCIFRVWSSRYTADLGGF